MGSGAEAKKVGTQARPGAMPDAKNPDRAKTGVGPPCYSSGLIFMVF